MKRRVADARCTLLQTGVRHKSGFCKFFTGNDIGWSVGEALVGDPPWRAASRGRVLSTGEQARPSPTTGPDTKTHKYVEARSRLDMGVAGEYTIREG
jgi:hypothetical protein